MHPHNCRCIQDHLRMLLQSLRALCLAPGGSGSVWKYLEALVRSPGVSGRIACRFRTELHFADVSTTLCKDARIGGWLMPMQIDNKTHDIN